MNLLNCTSADDLKVSIKCSVANNRPFPRELIEASLDNERRSVGSRTTVIKTLEAELRRQHKASEKTASQYRYAGSFGGAA